MLVTSHDSFDGNNRGALITVASEIASNIEIVARPNFCQVLSHGSRLQYSKELC